MSQDIMMARKTHASGVCLAHQDLTTARGTTLHNSQAHEDGVVARHSMTSGPRNGGLVALWAVTPHHAYWLWMWRIRW